MSNLWDVCLSIARSRLALPEYSICFISLEPSGGNWTRARVRLGYKVVLPDGGTDYADVRRAISIRRSEIEQFVIIQD